MQAERIARILGQKTNDIPGVLQIRRVMEVRPDVFELFDVGPVQVIPAAGVASPGSRSTARA